MRIKKDKMTEEERKQMYLRIKIRNETILKSWFDRKKKV